MQYGKTKIFTMVGLPLLAALSFLAVTATLAEAASSGPAPKGVPSFHRAVAGGGIGSGVGGFEATSAVSGSLTISGVAATNIGPTSAAITWTTDEASDSLVRYGTTKDALTLGASTPLTGTQHSVGLANLTPATEYFFEVESADGEGDTAVDNNGGDLYNFTTLEAELARRAFVGTVLGEPGNTVTLAQQGTGEEVTIILPEEYALKTPGGPRAGEFANGAEVVILAQRAGDDWVALRVLVKPVRPNLPVVGVVTGVGLTSLTVLDSEGNVHFLRLNSQVKELAAGEVVTVFRGNSNQARGLVRAEEVRQRMRKFLDQIVEAADEEAAEAERRHRGRRAHALIKGLETHGAQQLQVLDQALRHAPDKVKARIRAAKARAQKRIEDAQSAAGKAKGRLKQWESSKGDDGPGARDNPGQSNRGKGGANKDRGSTKSGNNPGQSNRGQVSEDQNGGGPKKDNQPGKKGNQGKGKAKGKN